MARSLGRPTTLVSVAVLAIVIVFVSKTSVDPDLWGHVRFGGDIVSARTVLRTDPYSFTSDQQWVNHEWLSEVVMFGAYSTLGQTGLVALKMILVLATLALATGFLERSGTPLVVTGLVLPLTVVGMASAAATVRPQLFSLLLFVVLLRALRSADRGRRWPLVWLPPLMALWVNLHGGWLVGMGVLGVWVACSVFTATRVGGDRLFLLVVAGLALGATLANPYGLDMWRFLWNTVGLGRSDISEWQPVYRAPLALLLMWSTVVGLATVLLVMNRRSTRLAYVVIVLIMAFLSFRVGRLTAFFAISVPLLIRSEVPLLPFPRRSGSSQPGRLVFSLVTLAACLPIVIVGTLEVSRSAGCIRMDTPSSWAVPDSDAGRYVIANQLAGRMVTFFDWGEYAIWHFSPRLKVSMDGRRETVYSQMLTEAHQQFYAGKASGLEFVDRLDADFIWLPAVAPAVLALEQRGWIPLFKGPRSVVFGRTPRRTVVPFSPTAGAKCFPGP